jgi:hypothetical protein
MPLDHYVSQVHLKNFYSSELGNLMYAMRKSDLKQFRTNAQSVCRTKDGSTNQYLEKERIIEDVLLSIEPEYNSSLKKLSANKVDADCIYVIAGFVAYILTCSPTAMRLQSKPLKSGLEIFSKRMNSKGIIPPPPKELGASRITELIESGKVNFNIDPKFPQAMGISLIFNFIRIFGNSKWEILINPFEDSPFFTSDFPVTIEQANDPRVHNKIVPLAPHLAVKIKPNYSIDRDGTDLSFSEFQSIVKKISRQENRNINKLFVRCAEETVFFCSNHDWIPKFVKKNSNFRIESQEVKIPHGIGMSKLMRWTIVDTRDD